MVMKVAVEKNPAQEFLRQVRLFDIHINNMIEEKARLEALAKKITSSWGSEHVASSGSQDKMGDAVSKIIDMEAKIDKAVDAFIDKKNEVKAVLEQIQIPDQLELLYKVYIQYESLEQVACEMNMSYRNACYIHGRALQTVESIIFGR
jgi:hypothetical protein